MSVLGANPGLAAGAALPPLREELGLYPGPATRDGAPTWQLHDPVRHQFYRIDWLGFELLSRWPARPAQRSAAGQAQALLDSVAAHTPLQPTPADVEQVLQFLVSHQLVQRHGADGSRWLLQQAQRQRAAAGGLWAWLLHHYLFFRVPLWRPDAWLQRALPWVAPLYSRGFAWLTLLAMLAGLVQVSRQWDRFSATLLDTFSWQGLAGYGLALAAVKFLHELGHAFTARRLGCRVPVMGVAFLVMFPVAYTDVNEAWKLPQRRQRLAVGAAGIATELAIAAWATLAWALLPDGGWRSAAFLLATTTWVSTLLINASPFMRFDGYFLLMDWLDLPNLHARAFGLGRWQLRRTLFGLRDAAPEALAAPRRRGLTAFAFSTWLYRLTVFVGIAVMVYAAVPKPLGPLLGGIELAFFIALPVAAELGDWGRRWRAIAASPRAWFTLALLGAAAAACVLPWDRRVAAQGVLRPARSHAVVAPAAARIAGLPLADGAPVAAGQLLAELQSPDLAFQQRAAQARAAGLRWQMAAAGVDARLRDRAGVTEAQAAKVAAELKGMARQQARHALRAPAAGHLVYTQPDLAEGAWLRKDEPLASVVDLAHWRVDIYLPEAELARVRVGDAARFHSESGAGAPLPMTVTAIDSDASRTLPEPMLASTHGGAVLVRQQHRQQVPEAAVYRVSLAVADGVRPPTPQVLRGQVVIQGRPKAWLDDTARSAAALWLREAGF